MPTKRARKSKAEKDTNTLLDAVRFVALAQQEIGTLGQTHSSMANGWIAASDGVLTAAAPIDGDLDACPHTRRLAAALERCGAGVSITQTDASRLAVKSGALRAVVACVGAESVPLTGPDANIAPLDDNFLAGCKAIAHIASESGARLHYLSLLVQGPTIMATNGAVLAEYWHGNDLPPYFVIPKTAVAALIRSGKTPTGFGFNQGRSCTFHFADSSWLKTQLFEDQWPNVKAVFDKDKGEIADPLPADFFSALALIGDFSDCSQVKFETDLLKTVNDDSDGAEYDVKGLIEGPKFNIKHLELIAPIAKKFRVQQSEGLAFFYGERLRGAISCYVL